MDQIMKKAANRSPKQTNSVLFKEHLRVRPQEKSNKGKFKAKYDCTIYLGFF